MMGGEAGGRQLERGRRASIPAARRWAPLAPPASASAPPLPSPSHPPPPRRPRCCEARSRGCRWWCCALTAVSPSALCWNQRCGRMRAWVGRSVGGCGCARLCAGGWEGGARMHACCCSCWALWHNRRPSPSPPPPAPPHPPPAPPQLLTAGGAPPPTPDPAAAESHLRGALLKLQYADAPLPPHPQAHLIAPATPLRHSRAVSGVRGWRRPPAKRRQQAARRWPGRRLLRGRHAVPQIGGHQHRTHAGGPGVPGGGQPPPHRKLAGDRGESEGGLGGSGGGGLAPWRGGGGAREARER